MREQIEILNTEKTANNRPLTDAELNEVSGAFHHFANGDGGFFYSTSASGWPSAPLTQNIYLSVYAGNFRATFQPFADMK
jgi:hypothetical protein